MVYILLKFGHVYVRRLLLWRTENFKCNAFFDLITLQNYTPSNLHTSLSLQRNEVAFKKVVLNILINL